jgi:hypothetical protein
MDDKEVRDMMKEMVWYLQSALQNMGKDQE